MRHNIKPLAYVRYGDDFVVFCRSKKEIDLAKQACLARLDRLGLSVNSKQEKIVRSWHGLHFLGHVVNKDNSTISRKTRNLMLRRVNLRNISSYSSLKLSADVKRLLPWLIDIS